MGELREALSWLREEGYANVERKADCKEVIVALGTSSSLDLPVFNVMNCRHLFKFFHRLSFKWARPYNYCNSNDSN